jgi:hypothetical protein
VEPFVFLVMRVFVFWWKSGPSGPRKARWFEMAFNLGAYSSIRHPDSR